jgi:hypothetical protein
MEETLEVLQEMGVSPLKRGVLEKLEQTYTLPRALLDLFRFVPTYASGVERLERWKSQELLLLRESTPYPAGDEDLSLDDYEWTTQVRCLGHTPEVLEKLDFVSSAFSTLPPLRDSLGAEMLSRTAARLDRLRERKITSADARFLTEAASLFEARRQITRTRRTLLVVSAACGGLLSCLLRFLMGNSVNSFWLVVFIIGAFFGGAACHGANRRALFRNAERILEACGSYCVSVAGEGAGNTQNLYGGWPY